MPNTEEKFWAQVNKGRESDCWEWTGYRIPANYGRYCFKGKQRYTHRFAYELTYGPIPAGMHVCHSCDNPPCCNPAHLWLGTASENAIDRNTKGRYKPGDRPNKKLTWAAVREIRSLYATGKHPQKDLARRFGVAPSTVRDAIHNKTWADHAGSR